MENKIPAEPQAIDTLSLQYPKFSVEIATARGHYSDEEITGYLSEKEQEALMHYQPSEVDTFLGRTPQSKQRIDDFTRQSKIYGYHKATGLMQPDIEERMTTAKKMNLNEAPLMSDDKLYTDIKKLADAPTDDTWTDYVKNKILIPLGVGGKQVLSSTLLAGTAVPLAGLQKQKEQYDAFVFEQMQPIYDKLGVGEDMKQLNAPENSLIRQSAIALLNVDKGFQEDLRAKYTQAAGEDPSLVSKIAHGVGTSIGFMLAASAAVASGQFSPKAAALIGAATEGGLEALSEAGSVLSDAAAEGKYDEGVSAAQNSFLTNLGLNTGLNYLGGRWNPWIAQMKPGIGKKLLQVGAEVGEEAFLQEPLQGVIENAAKQTLEEGGNFYSNLLESVKQYPEILEEVAPSTIGSTLITQMLFMGLSGSGGQKRPATQAQGQAQGQAQSRAVDMIAADRAEVEVNLRNLQPSPVAEAQATAPEQEQSVFLPREALETYNQENPGRLEELGVSTEGAGEIMMTPAQYDALVDSDLNFAETIRNDVRRGPTAMTNNEVVETLQKKITTAATTTPEYKAVVQDLEEKAIKAGRDKGEARAMARIGAAFAARLSEETGVSMADAVNIEMREMRYEDVERNNLEQSALHGSRANFNAVDLGYTGQGADTNANPDEGGHFGWGFYSTQEREHAEMYRKSVTEGESTGQLYKVDVPESDTVLDWDAPLAEQPAQVRAALESDELTRGIMDRAEASTEEIAALPADYQPQATTTKEVKTHFGDWIEVDITPEAREKLAGTLLPSIAINESKTKPGKYEINLGNGEIMARDSAEELISLAKDRLQQEYAEKLLAVIRENNISENYDGGSGGWLYQELGQELGSARAASEYLAKLGVPGLQYGNAKGSKDFVTWNEQAVDVLETYYQSAYHGTPHRFDKFDLSKIGSGEGAQVFGWGLYFAEDKTVAEGYRQSLSSDQQEKLERKKFSGRTLLGWYEYLEEQASRASTDTMQAYYDRMAIVENLLIHFNVKEAVQYAQDEGYSQEAIQWVEKTFKNLKVPGQLYKVAVPESEVLLDWDKPFSKQPTEVKNALEKLFKENKNPSPERGGDTLLRLDKKTTGEHIYLDIVDALGSPEKASKLLNTYGVPGLRYLDQGSRTSGEGTRNIVVFNDQAVDVLETYYQSAYHGSPYRFDNFDLSNIGSGEGTGAQGWGLYFAGRKELAEDYRANVSRQRRVQAEEGQLYKADIPKNSLLIAWDKTLKDQPRTVRKELSSILRHLNIDIDEGDQYISLSDEFGSAYFFGLLNKEGAPERNDNIFIGRDRAFYVKEDGKMRALLEDEYVVDEDGDPIHPDLVLDGMDAPSFGSTGEDIYREISEAVGGDKEASLLLNRSGIKGIRYVDDVNPKYHNYVIFDEEAIEILKTYYQEQNANKAPDNPNAAIEFLPGGKSLISFFENANKSSGFHEFSHHMFRLMVDVHDMEGVSEQFKTDVQTALRETGITLKEFREGSSKLRVAQERFATGFEVYLAEGKAPSKELRSVFRRLRTWLIDVYHNVSQSLGLELSPAMRDVYSRLLASPEQIDAEYEAQTKVKDLAVELAALKEEVAVMERKIRAADPTALPPKELDAYRTKIKAKQAQQKDINRLVKGINKMADSDKIIWSAQKDIQKLVSDYDLKRRSKNTQERRAELEAYLAANPGAEDTMNAADLKYLGTTTLNDMTIGDLRNLSGEVEALYAQGEQQFIQWDAERRQRGDEKGAALRKSLEKRKHTRPKIQMSAEDMGKQYKGLKGKAAKAKDWMFAATLGPDRFFDWLDGGATGYKGAFVKHFVDDFNKAQDGVLRNVFSRRQWLQDELRKLGFSNLRHFSKVVATVEGVDFTRDKIMEIYVGMRNEKKADAILRGTFGEVADPQGAVAYLVGQLTPEEKAAAELVVEDHDRNFDRINGALIQAFNKGMDQEESYTSIHRLEHGSPAGMIDAESFDAITDSAGAAGVLRRVEEGFMKKRVEMGRQTSIKLGLFENWHNDVSRHEHAAGMALIARDISSAMMSKNPADDMTLPKMVKERFGNEAWQTLVDFFNINVTDNARSAHNLLDNAASFLIKNMSVTYLAGNLATAMKQMTSIPRFLITAGPDKILGSILQFSVNPNGFLETVYDLDPQMRNRKGSAILQAIKEDPNWGNSVYQRTLDIAFAPISIMDRWVAAIGWKATYDANFKRLGHSGAVHEAQRATRLTQQASSSKDQARMWRQSGFVRATMVFSSDAAQTFGMTAYDLAQQMRTGQMTKAMSTILALTMTAVLMQAASKGLPSDEDDEESGASWLADAFLSQTIEAIPLVGKEIMLLYDRLSGQYRGSQYSAIVAPIEKIARAWKLWSDEDAEEGDDWKASGLAIEALSLTGIAPVPYTGVRRVMQSLSLAGESGTAAALNMVGIRPRKEE